MKYISKGNFIGLVMALLVSTALLISGCASGTTSTENLKIGVVTNLGWPMGLELAKGADINTKLVNQKGGVDIGGTKYQIQLITYDGKWDPAVARAAVERLIFQDKVKFILGDEITNTWAQTAEDNGVLTIGGCISPEIYNPSYKHTFQALLGADTEAPQVWGWIMKNRPNIKTMVTAAPDNEIGHVMVNQGVKQPYITCIP